jgi:superfamily II DNA or RNA helicase
MENNKDTIYIIWEKHRNNFKIGSTCNFSKRVGGYITSCDNFDNNTHDIWLFDIIKSPYNCYQLDNIIKKVSTKYGIPYIKYHGTGGTEFYIQGNIINLAEFLKSIGIKYTFIKVDVDELRQNIKKYTKKDVRETEEKDERNAKNSKSVSEEEINKIINMFTKFVLKKYQEEARKLIISYTGRLNHLIISPTGTGKTVIFSVIGADFISKYPDKDIMIVTKRKDILNQLPKRIDNYLKNFVSSNIVKQINYKIVDCINSCSTETINKKNGVPQIYIINWDKFTSSYKSDYKDINWNKFSLLITDESHWTGADGIYNMMMFIKENTKLNYLGFSATPIRCNFSNQQKTMEIYGDNKSDIFNILFEYSYYEALVNKDICPIKYCPIIIEFYDLEEGEYLENTDDELNSKNKKSCKVLSKKAFKKVWQQIRTSIIDKDSVHFKKGILWFRSRKELLEFYNEMYAFIDGFILYPTMSVNKKEKKSIIDLIEKNGLDIKDFEDNLKKFTDTPQNAILLSVMRATEGFDDDKLDFGIRMYYSNTIDSLNEAQKMGRFNRWYANKPDGLKKCGYYGTLEIGSDIDLLRKSIVQRCKSWITFARVYDKTNEKKTKDEIKIQLKEIINNYVDIETLKTYEIDIEKDIIKEYQEKIIDKYKIRNAILTENKKRKEGEKINTKSMYNEWASENNHPISDELEELGFTDFKWLFGMKTDDYLGWVDLKKLCKEYQNKFPDENTNNLFELLQKDINMNVPPKTMLHQIYKEYKSMKDLFTINI